jgi:hypothetical protein
MKSSILFMCLTVLAEECIQVHAAVASFPSQESLLEEALHTAGADDPATRAVIAGAQAKLSSCEVARATFREANDGVGSYANLPERERFIARFTQLLDVVRAEREAGCLDAMHLTVQKTTASIRQRYQDELTQEGAKDHAAAYYRLESDLRLGFLYWAAADFETLDITLDRIVPAIHAAQWRPDLQFQQAARLLARRGRDAEAMKVLSLYDAFYDREREISKDSYYLHWLYRATNLAAIAETQMEAGDSEKAKSTVKRAFKTARDIPVARLNEVLGNGNSLQSAALRTVAWAAAKVGEVEIAVEAVKRITDDGYHESVPDVVEALAKAGETSEAERLAQQFKCCGPAIALGFAERGAWLDAIEADEKWRALSNSRRQEITSRARYFEKLGKARTYAQGPEIALVWTRELSNQDKIHALLGIVDALTPIKPTAKEPRL